MRIAQAPPLPVPAEVLDDIDRYLDTPVISKVQLDKRGGVMKYWHQEWATTPGLARYASGYCSAPGMSAEYSVYPL